MIAIIDYDAGNLRSVFNAFEAIGQKAFITRDPAKLKRAKAIVLPGVGAFGDGMASLKRMNLIEVLNEEIVEKKKPYLGICLGMQFLANESEELGNHRGLGWIDGSVRIIRPNDPKFRIPHIGWNNIEVKKKAPLFEGFSGDPVFYFVHSYHLETEGS
ncbi:MAG: imidazole glycerol phosphate synthase subunit HisH, partial [Desulfobacteraceae bacterium]|nr:imidazole glycerol phosphate synthase subunit HisH [Desulfobacteraceae bacterium]